jgi:hypothetical protein
LGVIVLAVLATVAFLNPIRKSDPPRDLAHFTAFFFAPQGYGTMRRVLEKQ